VKLYDELKDGGYHSSIISTFNVDITFYDQVVQHRLRSIGCTNNILLVDDNMWRQTVGLESIIPRFIGRSYILWPVDASSGGGQPFSCFHPKLFLQLGKRQGRLIIGSANMTLKGYAHNQEILAEIKWSQSDEGVEALATRSIIRKAYDYLSGFLDRRIPSVEHKLTQIEREAPWLMEAAAAEDVFDLANGEQSGFLVGRSPDGGIARRFADWVGDEQVNRLVIVSPYWNEKMDAAHYLRERFDDADTYLLLQPKTASFPASEDVLNEFQPRELQVKEDATSRFLHAKIIVAEGIQFDHVLIGSANCTFAALGSAGHSGLNHEACLYRRLPAGWAKQHLKLDADNLQPVDWSDLSSQIDPEDNLEDISLMPRLPGMVEINGEYLTWWPAPGINAENAQCLVIDGNNTVLYELDAAQRTDKNRVLFIADGREQPIERVKFRLEDGAETAVAYVHDRENLRKIARGSGGSNLQNAIDSLRAGENDAIAFLDILHRLKSEDFSKIDLNKAIPANRNVAHGDNAGEEAQEEPSNGNDSSYTLDEFLKGRERAGLTAAGKSGILSAHDATFTDLLDMLRHVSFGRDVSSVIEVDAPELDDTIYNDEIGENDEGEAAANLGEPETPPVEPSKEKVERSTVAKARTKLNQEVQLFSKKLRDLDLHAAVPYSLSLELWLHLIMLALGIRSTDNERLLGVNPKDQEGYYPRLVATLLNFFFAHPEPSVYRRIEIDPTHDIIPDDIYELIPISAWSVCLSLAIDTKLGAKSFEKYLNPVAEKIYEEIRKASALINISDLRHHILELNSHQQDLPVSPEEILKIHDLLILENK
jgi:hypothetical protein